MRLTPNQRTALAAYPRARDFHTPPECQGQIVDYSYGWSDGLIFERAFDASDRTVRVTAYRAPADDSGEWDPWNGTPKLGRRIGVIFDGKIDDEPRG